MIENYVAFDFETASGKNPCSIGIVEFNKGEVVNEYYSLINPKIEKFNPFTTKIHGIRENDVINEREFNQVWNDICHFFENKIVIAHNSSFDLSVLNYSLERYNLKKPVNNCYCTLKISRRVLQLENYKLSTLAEYYSIQQINYHNALEDAYVCGKVFSKLLLEVDNVNSFLNNISYNSIKRQKPQSQTKSFKNFNENEQINIDLRFNVEQIFGVLTNKLINQTVVVSGVFQIVSRNELKKLIEDNGGKVSSSISSKTSYIVAGDNMGPSKKEKADKLNISIISEQDFLNMIQ
jgi:DNA polymerase-3 subunit epsilon